MDLPKFKKNLRKKPGPDPKPKKELRDNLVHYKLTDKEFYELKKAAKPQNRNKWARDSMLEKARRKNRRKM